MTKSKTAKTYVTPARKPTSTNKQADTLLRQIKTENAIRDLSKSNKRKGIVIPVSSDVSSSEVVTPSSTQTAKSKKK
jgi:hypothetical protein